MKKKAKKTKAEIRREKQEEELPYWPSVEYMNECLSQLKQKGVKAPKTELTNRILEAYWQSRAEILSK